LFWTLFLHLQKKQHITDSTVTRKLAESVVRYAEYHTDLRIELILTP
jgi:hypothetical protein